MKVLYSGLSFSLIPPHYAVLIDVEVRHEIAYVFGQLSSPYSIPSLIIVLRNPVEEDMVRHEAAEALGSIANEDCLPVLLEFAKNAEVPRVVRESCEVALDMVSPSSLVALWFDGLTMDCSTSTKDRQSFLTLRRSQLLLSRSHLAILSFCTPL